MSAWAANTHLELVTDVLDISKIEAGYLEVARKPFDLRQSILKTVQAVRPLAEKKGLSLRATIAPSVGTLAGDSRRVEQVLLNLLNNGVKFTERGGIELDAKREGDTVSLTVTDTGTGIPAEHIERVFDPFFQIDNGLTRRHEGTGLGLSISRKLAEKMGGSLTVESRPGEGSTFTFALPIQEGVPG